MNGKRLLLMEDEKVLGEILFAKLSREGFDIQWELDGEAGLASMKKQKPDLILLDIVMPKMDGYDVLEAMHKDETLKKIPVVVISNSGQPVEIERILSLGVKDYIVKAQFSPEEVIAKIEKYLGDDSGKTPKHTSASKKSALTIAVIEDDTFLSTLAITQLEKDGYKVVKATDGAQGLQVVKETAPDLVLLDIIMPVMNGFEVLKQMKADSKLKSIPVIVFSNLGTEQEIEEGRQLGAEDFLVKAKFTLKEVLEKIEGILRKHGKL